MIPMTPRQWVSFWRQFDIDENECWIWCGSVRDFPTYRVVSDTNSVREIVVNHRVARDENFIVMCGNPRCANPDHIELPADSYLGGATSLATPSLSSGGGVGSDPNPTHKGKVK